MAKFETESSVKIIKNEMKKKVKFIFIELITNKIYNKWNAVEPTRKCVRSG